MKALYLDCFAGISGNMLLGALLDAGVPEDYLIDELGKLAAALEADISISSVRRNGIAARFVDVRLKDGIRPEDQWKQEHTNKPGTSKKAHFHIHRTWPCIRQMIEESDLQPGVKRVAEDVFAAIAEAEGHVHGIDADKVVFHEVGAVDSIIDIVGMAICLDYLDIEKVFVSRVNTGSGFVECAHGVMPVPAPATAELLIGFPMYHAGDEVELTTPTGAGVIHALAEYSDGLPVGFVTEKTAYGAGSRELSIPNVLRVYIGEYGEDKRQDLSVIETNIDNMEPEIYGYVMERLFDAGAKDVWMTPIYMKKNRPSVMLSVLVDDSMKDSCIGIIFKETTTIGLRVRPVAERVEASRSMAVAHTAYGDITCKVSAYGGHIVSISAEYDDASRAATEHDVPLKEVQRAAVMEIGHRLGE